MGHWEIKTFRTELPVVLLKMCKKQRKQTVESLFITSVLTVVILYEAQRPWDVEFFFPSDVSLVVFSFLNQVLFNKVFRLVWGIFFFLFFLLRRKEGCLCFT